MARPRGTTPLIALDAVVIDIETTGLDPRSARAIEVAAVRLAGGRLDGRRVPPPDRSGRADPGGRDAHPRHRRCGRRRRAGVRRRPGRSSPPCSGDAVADRAHGRIRSCGAQARMRARGPGLGAAAGARHAPARRDRRAGACGLFARKPCRAGSASRSRIAIRRSATRVAAGADLPARSSRGCATGDIRTLAEAMRACRSLTRVLEQHHRAGWSETSQRRTMRRGARRTHRQLSLPPSRRRADVAGAVHRSRQRRSAPRSTR